MAFVLAKNNKHNIYVLICYYSILLCDSNLKT